MLYMTMTAIAKCPDTFLLREAWNQVLAFASFSTAFGLEHIAVADSDLCRKQAPLQKAFSGTLPSVVGRFIHLITPLIFPVSDDLMERQRPFMSGKSSRMAGYAMRGVCMRAARDRVARGQTQNIVHL